MLCSLNCLFIYAWEHAEAPSSHPPHWTTSFALRHLTLIAVINTAASLALAIFDRRCPWPIPAAIALSTALLLFLHIRRNSHSVLTLRASADLVLLTPLIFIPFV